MLTREELESERNLIREQVKDVLIRAGKFTGSIEKITDLIQLTRRHLERSQYLEDVKNVD